MTTHHGVEPGSEGLESEAVEYEPFAGPQIEAVYPLTPSQKEIWISIAMDNAASVAYNESFTIRLTGVLHEHALGDAIRALCTRHDALRASVSPDGASLCISDRLASLEVVDAGGAESAQSGAVLSKVIGEVQATPYDLTRGMLARFVLVRTAEREHTLVIGAHHLICDGWSLDVLLYDLSHLYDRVVDRSLPALGAAPRYADHSAAVRASQADGTVGRAQRYWEQQFGDRSRRLDLPTDYPRPMKRTYSAFRLRRHIPAAEIAALRAVAAKHGRSFFSALLAAFAVLMNRLSQQDDVVVGIPIATQPLLGLDALVGHCASFVPIRCNVRPAATVDSLLENVQAAVIDAREHSAFSYGELVGCLKLPRDPSRSPLVGVGFTNVSRYPRSRLGFRDLGIEYELNPRVAEMFDLHMNIIEGESGIDCLLHCNTSLFDRRTAELWLGDYGAILVGMAEAYDATIDLVRCVSPTDRELQYVAGVGRERQFGGPESLHGLVDAQVCATPDAIAVQDEGESLTYAELGRRAGRVASGLLAAGVGQGEIVGVLMERCANVLPVLYGILRCGAAYLPIETDLQAEPMRFLLVEAGVRRVVTDRACAALVPPDLSRCVEVNGLLGKAGTPGAPAARVVLRDAPACVVYTAGSTGRPKGVVVQHAAIANCVGWMQDRFALTRKDRVLHATPFSQGAAAWECFWPLRYGASVVVAPARAWVDPSRLVSTLVDHGVTVARLLPSVLSGCLEEPRLAECSGLRCVLAGGEPLPLELQRRYYRRLGAPLFNLYGSAEVATEVLCWECRPESQIDPVVIGSPMTNSRAYVLSQSLSPLPTGARGELCIGGVQVSLGYLGPAASTSERFVEDPVNPGSRLYRTGDLVRWRSEGVLQFLGRLDAGFDPRDMRADTSEIEGSLRSCPSVSDVVVAMQQSPGGETERLVAYIVSAHPGEELEQELRRLAERDLGPMARPASYVLLASFPRLPSGKIDRQRLPRPGTSAPSSLGASASGKPRTALERAILAVWETHLSTNGIDPSANFFDLGGDSLGAIRTMQELSEQMGIELPVVSLFQYPTVLSLAAHLSQIGNAPGVDRPLGARDQQRIEKRRGALSSHRKPPRADEP